jgi:hypothetical protein
VVSLVRLLRDQVDTIVKDVDSAADRLKTWGDAMQKAHDALYIGAANIQSLQISLAADIAKMNKAIDGLRGEIDSENKAIAAGALAVGLGIFALCIGIGVAIATLGAGLVVCGIAVAAIAGGAITWGIMQDKINKQFAEIAEDQKKIAEEERQIVALQGLSLAANSAISSIAIATQNLSDVKVMWQAFGNELKGIIDDLKRANAKVSMIVDRAMVNAAKKKWDLAVDFAQDLVMLKPEVEVKVLKPVAKAA